MGRIATALVAAANWAARPLGLTLVPTWKWRELRAEWLRTFRLAGQEYPFFLHHYNCGQNPETATERTVELALADRWLDRAPEDRLIEIGAVTPYYWPGRVRRVVDPTDPHPRVTERASILDLDLTGRAVLCLSTLEHIGSGEYGLPPDPTALRKAVEKLFAEAAAFLVTMPAGYNPHADAVMFDGSRPADVNAYYLVRWSGPPGWREVSDPAAARLPYGPAGGAFPYGANAVVVWERGGLLALPPAKCPS